MTSGQTGKDFWTWAGSSSLPGAGIAAIPAQTAQRYLVLNSWLKRSNAAAEKVDPAQVIAALAEGTAAQQLSDAADLGSGLAGGTLLGIDFWGFVAAETTTETGATVVVCTVASSPKAGGSAKPGPAVLAQAITEDGPGAWTFHLSDVDGSWRVDAVANPSPHLPGSCVDWYAGLRKQAGLPVK